MELIDGKATAATIKGEIRQEVEDRLAQGLRRPHLAAILVGHDGGSETYVKNKVLACEACGFTSTLKRFEDDITEEELLAEIDSLNRDPEVDGFIVQLPLPKHLNTNRVINAISPLKDVDGFHPYNTGMLQNNEKPYFVAATPLGVMQLIKSVLPNLSGKNVVLIGASLIVGRPLATLLLNQECTVTITHAQTRNIKELTSKADILVAACGVAKLVKADWIKENAVLIDVGINRDNGKICGDIDFDDVKEKALAITPVPGGVGPMTIAMLLSNTVDAFLLQHAAL